VDTGEDQHRVLPVHRSGFGGCPQGTAPPHAPRHSEQPSRPSLATTSLRYGQRPRAIDRPT
jgi:hypothetical protein